MLLKYNLCVSDIMTLTFNLLLRTLGSLSQCDNNIKSNSHGIYSDRYLCDRNELINRKWCHVFHSYIMEEVFP